MLVALERSSECPGRISNASERPDRRTGSDRHGTRGGITGMMRSKNLRHPIRRTPSFVKIPFTQAKERMVSAAYYLNSISLSL